MCSPFSVAFKPIEYWDENRKQLWKIYASRNIEPNLFAKALLIGFIEK